MRPIDMHDAAAGAKAPPGIRPDGLPCPRGSERIAWETRRFEARAHLLSALIHGALFVQIGTCAMSARPNAPVSAPSPLATITLLPAPREETPPDAAQRDTTAASVADGAARPEATPDARQGAAAARADARPTTTPEAQSTWLSSAIAQDHARSQRALTAVDQALARDPLTPPANRPDRVDADALDRALARGWRPDPRRLAQVLNDPTLARPELLAVLARHVQRDAALAKILRDLALSQQIDASAAARLSALFPPVASPRIEDHDTVDALDAAAALDAEDDPDARDPEDAPAAEEPAAEEPKPNPIEPILDPNRYAHVEAQIAAREAPETTTIAARNAVADGEQSRTAVHTDRVGQAKDGVADADDETLSRHLTALKAEQDAGNPDVDPHEVNEADTPSTQDVGETSPDVAAAPAPSPELVDEVEAASDQRSSPGAAGQDGLALLAVGAPAVGAGAPAVAPVPDTPDTPDEAAITGRSWWSPKVVRIRARPTSPPATPAAPSVAVVQAPVKARKFKRRPPAPRPETPAPIEPTPTTEVTAVEKPARKPDPVNPVDELRAALGWAKRERIRPPTAPTVNATGGLGTMSSSLLVTGDLPISARVEIDARSTPLGAYLSDVEGELIKRWFLTDLDAGSRALVQDSSVVLVFNITRVGRLADVIIEEGSGYPDLDLLALSILQERVPRIPRELGERKLQLKLRLVYRVSNPG